MKRLFLALSLLPALALADLRYTLTAMPQAQSVRVTVTMDSTGPEQGFRIPAWCPGFYFLLDYQSKISDVRATDAGGNNLRIQRGQDARSWVVTNPNGGKVTLSYRVLGDDPGLGFFATNVRADTAFVNGPSAFMYPEGHKEEICHLRVNVPQGWDVATAMPQEEGGYVSGGYDELLDHPIQMGAMVRKPFNVEGIPFEAIFVSTDGKYPSNMDAAATELKELSRPALLLFKEAGFKKYLFIIHLSVGNFGGGLEHRASNVVAVPPSQSVSLGTLASHEYFHAWNVKQFRPKILGPFDYTKEQRTGNLWFAEGVTDYYAYVTAYRSGRYQEPWLLDNFTSQIRTLQAGTVRKKMTLEEACKAAWENGGFSVGDLDYYNKGFVAGLVFDATIRSATNGKKSLDDVMRMLWSRHRLPNPGYDEESLMKAINEVSGKDFTALYRTIVQSTDEIPYEPLLGIGLRVRQPGKAVPVLGFEMNGAIVSAVGDSAEAMGLEIGDKLIAANGRPFELSVFDGLKAGTTYRLTVSRNNQTVEVPMKLGSTFPTNFKLERDPFAAQPAAERLKEYLQRLPKA